MPQLSREEILSAAESKIERNRKEDARIRVVDSQGAPLRNCQVSIELCNHEFQFGGPVICNSYFNPNATEKEALHRFVNTYNSMTAICYWDENWHRPIERFQGRREMSYFLEQVDWARANGLLVKGHTLIFAAPKCFPKWLDKYDDTTAMKFLEYHIRSMIASTEGKVWMWDLCNEMLWEASFRNRTKRVWPHMETTEELLTYIEPAMRWARDEDPRAEFMLNEYGLEDISELPIPAQQQRQRLRALVDEMRRRGVAPDAIGTQCHTSGWSELWRYWNSWDDLALAGLPIHITEFWIHLDEWKKRFPDRPEEEFESDRIRHLLDFYTIAFGHLSIKHLSYWVTLDASHPYSNKSHSSSYAMNDAVHKLIKDEWTTKCHLTTDSEGFITFRGFKGLYSLKTIANERRSAFGKFCVSDALCADSITCVI